MSKKGTFLLIGSGPGIGRSTASLFAERNFKHFVLLSRDAKRLEADADIVRKAAASEVKIDTLTLDLAGNKESIEGVLREVDALIKGAGSQLEVVLYNAARVGPSRILEWGVEGLEEDLRVSSFFSFVLRTLGFFWIWLGLCLAVLFVWWFRLTRPSTVLSEPG